MPRSRTGPLRPDGKPNQPITALDLMVVPVEPGTLPSILPEPGSAAPRLREEAKNHGSAVCSSCSGHLRALRLSGRTDVTEATR